MNRFLVLALILVVGLAACGGLDDGDSNNGLGGTGGNNMPAPFVPTPDATLTTDGGGDVIIFPDGGSVADSGTIQPDGGSISDGGIVVADGGTVAPDGGNTPDGGTVLPDGGTTPNYGSFSWVAQDALVNGEATQVEWTVINWDTFSCPGGGSPQQQTTWPGWKCEGGPSYRGSQINFRFTQSNQIAPGQKFQVYIRNISTDTKRYGCNGWVVQGNPNNPYREINGTGAIAYPNGNIGTLTPVNVDIAASGAANCIAPVGSLTPPDGGIVTPDGGNTPDGGTVLPDGGLDGGIRPDGGLDGGVQPDGGTSPDGGVITIDSCNDVYGQLFPAGNQKHLITRYEGFKVVYPGWVPDAMIPDIEYMVEEYYRDFGNCYDTARAQIRADGGTLVGPTQNFIATTRPAIPKLTIIIPDDPAYQPYYSGGYVAGLYTHKPYYTANPVQMHCIVAWWGTEWVNGTDGGVSGWSQEPFTQGIAHAIPHELMHWFNWLTRGTNDVDHENFNRDTAFQSCQGYSINDSCVIDQ